MFRVGALEVGGHELSKLDRGVVGAGVEVLEGLLLVVLVLVLVIGGFAGS